MTNLVTRFIYSGKDDSMTSLSSALIVVSNRLPFTLEKDKDGRIRRRAAAGGLGTAVAPVVVQSKGKLADGYI
jgi:trehalose-6-phosphate synthase